jgi:carnosine N-methyltransferase
MWSEDEEENAYFERGLVSLAEYRPYAQFAIHANYTARNQAARRQIPHPGDYPTSGCDIEARGAQLQQCAAANAAFLERMLVEAYPRALPFDPAILPLVYQSPVELQSTQDDLSKARSTLLQLAREWSSDGAPERAASMGRCLMALEREFPEPQSRGAVMVSAPGSGLGRLVLETVLRGFSCEGNEFSSHMLLVGQYMLNHFTTAAERDSVPLFPYIHNTLNCLQWDDCVFGVRVPDIVPSEAINAADVRPLFSMAAGEFVDVYSKPEHGGRFDAVVTCYFLDTAANVFDYVRTIEHMLRWSNIVEGKEEKDREEEKKKKKKVWIHYGPLMFHYAEDAQRPSVICCVQDIIRFAESRGFVFDQVEHGLPSTYCANPRSMMQTTYYGSFWVAHLT